LKGTVALDSALAERIVDMVSDAVGQQVIVCNHEGKIIAATVKSRIGTIHEKAIKILNHEMDEAAVTPEDVARNPLLRTGYNCPIVHEGKRIGTIGITGDPVLMKPLARIAVKFVEAELASHAQREYIGKEVASGVASALSAANKALEASRAMSEVATALTERSREMQSRVSSTTDILELIGRMTTQINLLGLNASIEAAHAGAAGAGFAVVASEIRKLADSSKSSVDRIRALLDQFSKAVAEIDSGIKQTLDTIASQSGAIETIAEQVAKIQASLQPILGHTD